MPNMNFEKVAIKHSAEFRAPFPHPLITAPGKMPAPDCGCSWAHAPEISHDPDRPWVLKYVYNIFCKEQHFKKTGQYAKR